jgi:PadR family transcriptional regulator, regulatory protein AphA
MPGPTLSATSAALLGQLAWREQTPYELTKAMGRNLRYFWPRAESHVYREVKRLVADGHATASRGATGRRPRTVYAITPAGRDALARWLASAPGGVTLEHEPLLRVFLGSGGTRADVLEAVAAARAQAEVMLGIARGIGDEYLAERHDFQEEVHIRQFSYDYLSGWARHTVEWADRTEAEVRRWRDLRPTPAKHRRALDHIRRMVREVVRET